MFRITHKSAVAGAALLAITALVSCTKEETEPSAKDMMKVSFGAVIGSDQTKTVIGTKEGDIYPIYWVAGDKLSINGTATSEAQFVGETAKTAHFTAEIPSASEYYAVYPYTAGNGAGEVTFGGTVLPMAAYTTDISSGTLSLKALYGVLKLSVTGTAVISGITVSTQDGDQISGKFTVDKDGNITGAEPAAKELTISFTDPIQLSATAHDFFIPVPKGTYNIFDIRLIDNNGGSMTKKIGGGDNYEVKAGVVKEFPSFEYKVNSHLYAIASEADLEKFAAAVKAGTLGDFEGGLLCADSIKLTKSWTSIESFSGIFEGKNRVISNLDAPLFNTLDGAKISNLVIDANATNTSATSFGALANTASGSTVIDNCKICGKVTLNLEGSESTSSFSFAGLVGTLNGGTIKNTNSTCYVSAAHPGARKKTINVGSIAGTVADGATLDNCSISGNFVKAEDKNGSSDSTTFNIGGIAGYALTGSTITGCHTDKGCTSGVVVSIRMDASTYSAGGIVGRCDAATISNCVNNQTVTASKANQKVKYIYAGGILGSGNGVAVSGCSNYGQVYAGNGNGETTACNIQVRLGGIAAGAKGDATISGVINSGTIQYSGNPSLTTTFGIGGILGVSEQVLTINNWENSGKIKIASTAPAKGSTKFSIAVGGLLGYQSSNTIAINGYARNSGVLTVRDTLGPVSPSSNNYAYVGGCVGAFRGTPGDAWNFENTGDISVETMTVEGSDTTYTANIPNVCAGGIFGHTSASSSAATHAKFYGSSVFCTIKNNYKTGLLCGWEQKNKEVKNCRLGGTVNDTELNSTDFESKNFTDGSGAVVGTGTEANQYWDGK